MRRELFRAGGPHGITRVGRDRYSFQITIPADEDGQLGRECAVEGCAPAYFKVKPGTGVVGQDVAYCPYCRHTAEPGAFATPSQLEFGKRTVEREAVRAVGEMIRDSLGLDGRGRRELGGGLVSMSIEMQSPRLPVVGRPVEEELQRDVTCPECTLAHAVFGLATWCPDCGADIFPTHLAAELGVLRQVLADVPDRRARLGPRVAARDVENTLEDVVSILEAVLKFLTKRHLRALGRDEDAIEVFLRREVRTRYQNLVVAAEAFHEGAGVDLRELLPTPDFERLTETLEKRHPIAHNLGVVDRKYLERARAGGLIGREIRVTEEEVRSAIDTTETLLRAGHERLFGDE